MIRNTNRFRPAALPHTQSESLRPNTAKHVTNARGVSLFRYHGIRASENELPLHEVHEKRDTKLRNKILLTGLGWSFWAFTFLDTWGVLWNPTAWGNLQASLTEGMGALGTTVKFLYILAPVLYPVYRALGNAIFIAPFKFIYRRFVPVKHDKSTREAELMHFDGKMLPLLHSAIREHIRKQYARKGEVPPERFGIQGVVYRKKD